MTNATKTNGKAHVSEPITVSKTAYKDLLLLKKAIEISKSDKVRFPETDTKFSSITELYRKKKIIGKEGERQGALYFFIVPFEQVEESARSVKGTGANPQPSTALKAKPVISRGGYKPTFQVLVDFVKAVENESRDIAQGKNDELEARISEMSQALAKTKNKDERNRYIQELGNANDALHSLSFASTIEAVKNCSAMSAFRQYNFDDIISIAPEDYQNQ